MKQAKLVECKTCGSQIAANAKVCPNCGAKQKKPIYKKWWFYVLIVGVLLAVISSAGTKSQTASGTGTTNNQGTVGSSDTKSESLYEVTNIFTKVHYNDFMKEYYYDAIVEVENISDSNIKISSEKFDVLDANGVSVSHDSFSLFTVPDIVKPGEKAYIYTWYSQELTDITEEESQNLQLQYSFTASTTSSESYRYPVSDVKVTQETYGSGVNCVGTIENDTDKDDDYIYITVVYFDSSGKPIGAAGTSVDDLEAGKKAKFEISGLLYEIKYSDVASYVVYAER